MSVSTNQVFNIQNNSNQNQTSIATVGLIFYVLVASNYTDNLMAKQMKEFINNNRIVQHIIGFLAMLILVMQVGGIVDTRTALIYALLGYIWFLFSTKLDIHWNVVIILLLFIGLMVENSIKTKENEMREDPTLDAGHKMSMIQKYNDYKLWIVESILLVTIAGTLMYSYKKHVQYGGGYDIFTYLLN